MGKSKNGGTRSYVRGRIGSDVYSIGKDGKGKKQQVIRSLAETVANPQTTAQMRGRMIMATVMQAVSAMSGIIDHSFDSMPAGQPNISEFISRNYQLVKADVAANPSSGNKFGLNKYQEKGVKKGAWLVSEGKAAGISGVVIDGSAKTITIALGANLTFAGLKAALGLAATDYFTAVAIDATAGFVYQRFHLSQSMADDTAIAAGNVADLFTSEGNTTAAISLSGSNVVITLGAFSENNGIIVSRAADGGYKHSTCVLADPTNPVYTAEVALATYPVGAQRFLNGGDEVSFSGGNGSVEPTPEVVTVAAPVISGSTSFTDSTQVSISADNGAEIRYTTDGTTPTAGSTLYSAPFTLSDTATVQAIAIKDGQTSSVASKTFTKGSGGGGGGDNEND